MVRFSRHGKRNHYLPPNTGDPVWHLGHSTKASTLPKPSFMQLYQLSKQNHTLFWQLCWFPSCATLPVGVFVLFHCAGCFFFSASAGSDTVQIGDPQILRRVVSQSIAGFVTFSLCWQELCEHLLLNSPCLSEAKASSTGHFMLLRWLSH